MGTGSKPQSVLYLEVYSFTTTTRIRAALDLGGVGGVRTLEGRAGGEGISGGTNATVNGAIGRAVWDLTGGERLLGPAEHVILQGHNYFLAPPPPSITRGDVSPRSPKWK